VNTTPRPLFAAPPLDAEDGDPIAVADTDDLLGEALVEGKNDGGSPRMTAEFPRFAPASDVDGSVPLFVDTNAIVAHLCPGASRHDEVRPVVQAIGANELPYYPLVTTQYVLDEIVSLLLSYADTRVADAALYLASELASFVTGHSLVVDGGVTATK